MENYVIRVSGGWGWMMKNAGSNQVQTQVKDGMRFASPVASSWAFREIAAATERRWASLAEAKAELGCDLELDLNAPIRAYKAIGAAE